MSSKSPLPLQCKQEDKESVHHSQEIVCAGWTDLRTRSLISITEAFRSVSTYPSTPQPCSSFPLTMPRFRINVDTLVGAKETDVDTGQAVISRSVDLSVVSGYLLPQTQIISKARVSQVLSEPPHTLKIASPLNFLSKTALQPKFKWNTQDCTGEDKQEFFI